MYMVSPKKIAVLCNYELLPERVGGMDYFFWQFDAKCKENNIQIDWFFPNHSLHGSYSQLTIHASEKVSVEANFLDFLKREPRNYKYIITHFLEICTPFFKKMKQYSEAKIIAVDHNPRPIGGYPLKKRLEKKLKGWLYAPYIYTFIGVSEYTVRELLNDFGGHLKHKTVRIYNGITLDVIDVRQQRLATQPCFLTASHLRESKGIQDLIQAVFLLPESIKQTIHIAVYGDGPYKKQLQDLTTQLAVAHCFDFKGSTSNLKAIYCKYDYMLQPTHMECFSLSILESLAANVPVITTNVGGNEEAVIDTVNGYIFNAKDIPALARILEGVYVGTKQIELNTRTAIEKRFSLEQMVANHFRLLE